MSEFQASPYGGHSSIKPTLKRIAASFYWPKWSRDIHSFVQQWLSVPEKQIHANKNSRSSSTITNSRTSLGRYIYWFYYSPSNVHWPFCHLGNLRQIDEICPLPSSDHILHRPTASQTLLSGNMSTPWSTQNHRIWPWPLVCQYLLATPVQGTRNHVKIQFVIPPTNWRPNGSIEQGVRSIPQVFCGKSTAQMVSIHSLSRAVAQHHLPFGYRHLTFPCSLWPTTTHRSRFRAHPTRRCNHPGFFGRSRRRPPGAKRTLVSYKATNVWPSEPTPHRSKFWTRQLGVGSPPTLLPMNTGTTHTPEVGSAFFMSIQGTTPHRSSRVRVATASDRPRPPCFSRVTAKTFQRKPWRSSFSSYQSHKLLPNYT